MDMGFTYCGSRSAREPELLLTKRSLMHSVRHGAVRAATAARISNECSVSDRSPGGSGSLPLMALPAQNLTLPEFSGSAFCRPRPHPMAQLLFRIDMVNLQRGGRAAAGTRPITFDPPGSSLGYPHSLVPLLLRSMFVWHRRALNSSQFHWCSGKDLNLHASLEAPRSERGMSAVFIT